MSSWHWQDDSLWQSCGQAARARAKVWRSNGELLYDQLRLLAQRQPLVALADDPAQQRAILGHVHALQAVSQQLVVVGTGGASLGAQALCALSDQPQRVQFLENCDPVTLEQFFRLDKQATSWCIISKSGETVETLAAALALIRHYQDGALLRPRVRVITAVAESTLGQLAAAQGWEIVAHPAALGGRFSVFSVVGLFPAAYAGLDMAAISRVARDMLQHLLTTQDDHLLSHALWLAANAHEKNAHVLMAYADRLRPATQWFKQLWAESLGKQGKGSTPVTAIGAIDQHSQLQLYLDGPRDKLVTLWLPQVAGQGAPLAEEPIAGLAYLAGHKMGDVMRATSEATAATLAKAGVPLRVARGVLTPQSLAEWFVRQMLEVLLAAILLEVDPYSQPAVEEGKNLTRAALAKRG